MADLSNPDGTLSADNLRYHGLSPVKMNPTPAEIEAAKTERGGWTREELAKWGVPWPPPKGWRKMLAESTT